VVRGLRIATAAALAALSVSLLGAGGAEAGYGPFVPPGPPVPGGFSIVIASRTFGPYGGMLRAHRGSTTFILSVPRGALSRRTQFTLTGAHGPAVQRHLRRGLRLKVAVAVLANLPSGKPIKGTFSRRPVHLLILNRHVASNSEALRWSGRRRAFIPLGGAQVRRGRAAIRLRHFAEIVVARTR
jgi:hypothetical protein